MSDPAGTRDVFGIKKEQGPGNGVPGARNRFSKP